jgi:hypothetical protein
LFIFLITLLGVVTWVALMILHLPAWSEAILIGLPLLFYLFTFVDLGRTAGRLQRRPFDSYRAITLLLAVGLAYFLFAPSGAGNLIWQNRPSFFTLEDSSLAPRYSRGSLLLSNSLEYYVDLAVVKHPIMHTLPSRLDIVSYEEDGEEPTGVVLGLPGEEVEVIAGTLIVNGLIFEGLSPTGTPMTGDLPLTLVGSRSILIADFQLGHLVRAHEIDLTRIEGKVTQLW